MSYALRPNRSVSIPPHAVVKMEHDFGEDVGWFFSKKAAAAYVRFLNRKPKKNRNTMKKALLAIALLAALALPAVAQTNPPAPASVPLLDILTTGSNYFAVPFGTYARGDHSLGGGLALGYKATEALAPVVRIEQFAGKCYLGNLSLQLSVPRSLMGKIPFVPFALAGAGIPLSTATIDNNLTISAGSPVGIVGIGAYMPLDWVGSGAFWQKPFLVADYEHWSGAGIPTRQQNQLRFGFGIKF